MQASATSHDRNLMRWALLLVATVTIVRLVIICITPFELAGDEAQYWDWSRRLAPSYYSKGPGVAWTIAASTALFGSTEWAIRLPSVLSGTITLISGLWLAAMLRPSAPGKAALYAVLALIAIPVLHGASLLMTIDSPYVACWALSCALAWWMWQRLCNGHCAIFHACLLGLALGGAFLYKYTALMLPVGMLLFCWSRWRDTRSPRETRMALAIVAVGFAVCTLPVVIWNAQHDWITVRHLMGHLGMAGGDLPTKASTPRDNDFPIWTIEYIGAQLGVIGPLLILMVLASIDAIRHRRTDAQQWSQNLFLMLCGWPVFILYFFVSLTTDIEANWPMAGAFSLALLAAKSAANHMDHWRQRVVAWRALPAPRPRAGVLLARPESLWQVLWHVSLGFGVVSLIGLAALPWLTGVPVIGQFIPVNRVSGGRAQAQAVDAVRDQTMDARIIATRYNTAARLAYYLRNHPPVSSASVFLGDRGSSYDYFADTRLDNPALYGTQVILVGGSLRKWEESGLQLADLRMVDEENRIAIARFAGLKNVDIDSP